jgi:hypothetical protein
VFVNAGGVGDDYEAVHGLPFERAQRNGRRLAATGPRRLRPEADLVR